jgi:hypothetical protein
MYTYEDENDPGSAKQIAYDAMANSEVGGGSGYDWPDQPDPNNADVVVSSGSDFWSAIRDSSVEHIYIPSDTTVNITNDSSSVSGPKVIYGDGPESGSLLYSESDGHGEASGSSDGGHLSDIRGNVRITGLEIRGWMYDNWPDSRWPGYEPTTSSESGWEQYVTRFGSIRSSDVRVDNCDIHGWGEQAFGIGANSIVASPEIDHNKIHNCMLTSLGYAATVYRGRPHFHHNYISACRHGINGFGYYDSSYIIEDNLFGPYWSSHQIDCHSLGHNGQGSSDDWRDRDWHGNAGGDLVVRRNTFMSWRGFDEPDAASGLTPYPNPVWPIAIRGYPWTREDDDVGMTINNNRVVNPIAASEVFNAAYRDMDDQCPWTQQLSRSNWTIPDSQIRDGDNYTINWYYFDNQYDAYGKGYDSNYGAPVAIEGELTEETAQLRVYVEDSSTGERINGAEVTINRLDS